MKVHGWKKTSNVAIVLPGGWKIVVRCLENCRQVVEQEPSQESKKKGLEPVCLTSNDKWMPHKVSYKSVSGET